MLNKSYIKGRRFEGRVKKFLEEKGWFVVRQYKSRFPDLIAVRQFKDSTDMSLHTVAIVVECKWNKHLSKEEQEKLLELEYEFGFIPFRAYLRKEGRKSKIVLERIVRLDGKIRWFEIDWITR
ncbi:MAG: hypothetical protein ACTSQY_00855 [Candidatus Odinarchaeia archaeon]